MLTTHCIVYAVLHGNDSFLLMKRKELNDILVQPVRKLKLTEVKEMAHENRALTGRARI